jgi:hypothetical protein
VIFNGTFSMEIFYVAKGILLVSRGSGKLENIICNHFPSVAKGNLKVSFGVWVNSGKKVNYFLLLLREAFVNL